MNEPGVYAPRRVVTANAAGGKSYILSDGPTPHVLELGPARGLINFWATDRDGPDLAAEDGAARPVRLEPPDGGTVFRFFQLSPRPAATVPAELIEAGTAAAFEIMEAAHLRVDTTRDAGMHLSSTLDYIVLLRGRVKLVLDKDETVLNPFDVVIQRGTNHAWVNLEDTPALLLAVLIDASHASREAR